MSRVGTRNFRPGDMAESVHHPDLDWREVVEVGDRGIRLMLLTRASELLPKQNYRVAREAGPEVQAPPKDRPCEMCYLRDATGTVGTVPICAECIVDQGVDPREFRPFLDRPAAEPVTSRKVDVVFDGPPSAESGRFIEVEDENGASISIGEWIDRGDGTWALRLTLAPTWG